MRPDQGSLFSRSLTILGAFATVYSQNRALPVDQHSQVVFLFFFL